MTSSTVTAYQPKSGMRFVTLLMLVALAHVLVIVLILAHFGWLNGVGTETDDNVGQSGIVIPVTLETAGDKENRPEEKVEPSEESTPEQAPPSPDTSQSPDTSPSVEPPAETPSQSTTEIEKEIPLAAEPEAEAKPNVAPPVTRAPAPPLEKPSQVSPSSNSASSNAAVLPTATTNDSLPTIPARVDPNYLHRPNPVYPAVSKRLREEGTVLLRVSLDTTGAVLEVTVQTTSTYQRLDLAAVEAVRQWRFIPATRGQQPVASTVLVPIAFKHQ